MKLTVLVLFMIITLTWTDVYSVRVRLRTRSRRPKHGVDDETVQYCVKPVNETVFPKCMIIFREEGTFDPFNATCLEDNVFVVNPNRTRPEKPETDDYKYLSVVFEEQLPPYARITCTSSFPSNFEFEGVGALDFFRVWKSHTLSPENSTIFSVNAEVLLTPEATGEYIFYSIDDPKIRTTFFIFSERGYEPYLIGGDRVIQAPEINDSATTLPCIASDIFTNVTVFKVDYRQNQTSLAEINKSETPYYYDRKHGFIANSSVFPPGDYRCLSNIKVGNESADFVTVHIMSTIEDRNHTESQSKLKLDVTSTGSMAVCYSLDENPTSLHFSNAQTSNPTESKLLIDCLRKKNPYCGSHSYHKRREGQKINRRCPEGATNCLWITAVHSHGIFYCDTGDTSGVSISKEYFTGLDGKIYDTSNAATISSELLIRPAWEPELKSTNLTTGVFYRIYCETVELILLRDPYTITIKYKNGTSNKFADVIWWAGGEHTYLTTDIDEIICADKLWSTNHVISSHTKINVTMTECEHDQFQCTNGECIWPDGRCDGQYNCNDQSDEHNCSSHHCKSGYFKCANGLCTLESNKCNNIADCTDGSDESHETCSSMECSSEFFKCASGQCTPLHFLCDGGSDCFDESDERKTECSKYYPQFTPTTTKFTFNLHTTNELVCKISHLPPELKPTMTWLINGQNISDSDPGRIWQSLDGLNLALRFENVSLNDVGDFTCAVTNHLQSVEQVFTVTVQVPEPVDMSCRPELKRSECLKRGCYYTNKICTDEEMTTTSTTTTEKVTTNTPERPSQEAALSSGKNDPGGQIGVIIGVTFLILLVVTFLIGGLCWKGILRKPCGASGQGDQDGVLRGIQLQNTNN